ncbi:alpha/beta fold hydrolase [Leptospira adleri]|uniref:alpha/beta fold hydrolase n=1 Tax=Leptospira adleri TaxID=2023186 RepID=UPI001082A858|nr:alpha/beta hydrolase [Leptospira adleri]TGM61696.1 alpha/beta hydrolase [Leptospira adleri]
MSLNLFRIITAAASTVCFLSFCRIPEDLQKKPEESLRQLEEEGVSPREVRFLSEGLVVYGVTSGCESKNENIIIFIHGSPGGWQNYAWYLGDKILTSSFCILSVDRPGFGKSNNKISLPDVEKQSSILAKTILEFRKSISKEEKGKTILVGHSYGGPIAARIASFPKSRIDGLLLLAAPLSGEAEEVQWYNRIADWNWLKALLPTELNHSNSEMLPLKEQLFALEPYWKNIRCKTVLIHGKKDSLVPYQNLEYFQTQLSNTVLKTIPLEDENHFIPWTQKELIQKTILEFIRTCPKTGTEPCSLIFPTK